MHISDAVPNALIGLREGLEAGLVVSILLAAVARLDAGDQALHRRAVWLGVIAAVSLAGSFAAVLTYSTDTLSSRAQDGVGGVLSVAAVGLVTAMVFWMRRTAAGLSARLRGEVSTAVSIGAGALTLTAFLAVGREGLETTLFLWTAARATGQTVAPLLGAALGLVAAVVVCVALFKRAIRLDLGRFFARTALLLIVIAAGVLAYGLGDAQEAGLLPGINWVAFDLTAHADPNSWWVTIISGVTELSPKMTVLQVVAWLIYLAVVMPAFVRAGASTPSPAAATTDGAGSPAAERWARLAGRRAMPTAATLVLVPAVVAAATIAVVPAGASGSTTSVDVTARSCAGSWHSGHTGNQTFQVDDRSPYAGEINLDDASGAAVAEIETIGPGTTAPMTADLGPGTYTIHCLMAGRPATSSAEVTVSGPAGAPTTPAVAPVTVAQLTGPNDHYQAYVAAELRTLAGAVTALRNDLSAGDRALAEMDWLAAQLDWERVGASYDSFGNYGQAVDGLPDGLPGGVADPGFTGLHRLEYGLWSGQALAELVPAATATLADITTLEANLTSDDVAGDPTNLPIRAHEIIEDALRDHLSGIDDEGAGAAYAETWADLQVDEVVVGELAPLISTRDPKLLPAVRAEWAALDQALAATRTSAGGWLSPQSASLAQREQVDAAIGALLESLAEIPNLLEVPPT